MFSSVCMLWYHKKNISPESCSKVLRAACCETGPALRQSRHYQPTVRFLLCPSFRDGCLHSKYIICDKNNQVQIHSINPPEEPKLSEVVRNGPELPRCVNDLAELRSRFIRAPALHDWSICSELYPEAATAQPGQRGTSKTHTHSTRSATQIKHNSQPKTPKTGELAAAAAAPPASLLRLLLRLLLYYRISCCNILHRLYQVRNIWV